MAEHRQAEDRVVVLRRLRQGGRADREGHPLVAFQARSGGAGRDVGRIDVEAPDGRVRQVAAQAEDLVPARAAE